MKYLLYKLSRFLGWTLRKEQPLVNWLNSKGLSLRFAKRLLTIINLFIIISALFMLLPAWCMLIVLFFAAAAFMGVDIDIPSPPKEEWRMGPSGYGLYRGDECIIWSDDPNDPNE